MKSKDWSNRFIIGMVGSAVCAALLCGTSVFAQNPVLDPPSDPESQPRPRTVRFMQPKAAEEQPKAIGEQPKAGPQPMPGVGPIVEKGANAGKEAADKIEASLLKNGLPAPALEPGEEGLVISLPAALRLTNVRAWDITIAIQQLQIAQAQRLGADVLWLPTLTGGTDYQYHSGPAQDVGGTVLNSTHDSLYSGGSPLAIFAVTDAIFTPLAARQVVRAQDANIQTSRNDTLTDLAQSYFDLMEAQADLASIADVDRRAAELVSKIDSLVLGLVPEVEKARVRATKANIEQVVETARQRWRNASAEVARIARLKPTVVLQPLEAPHIRVTLVSPALTPEQLVPIAIAARPELTFYEAQAAAARQRERQEKWRPFLPTFIARGGGSTPPYPMAYGGFATGMGTSLGNAGQRSDWDFSAIWTVQNLGAGNLALIRERRRETELALSREYRFRDLVAREVTVAWSDVRSADRRFAQAERELIQAEISARKNMQGVSEFKRPGQQIFIEVIRPQEVVQALQALNAAYFNYYGVVAEYNRAQFRMYRALGSPAQMLEGHNGLGGAVLNQASNK